jgi:hypothetical protein
MTFLGQGKVVPVRPNRADRGAYFIAPAKFGERGCVRSEVRVRFARVERRGCYRQIVLIRRECERILNPHPRVIIPILTVPSMEVVSMTRLPSALALALTLVLPLSAAPIKPTKEPDPFIDLKDHINVKHKDNLHTDRYPGNNLSSLPTGKQKFGDVEFNVGEGVMQLGSSLVEGKPASIEGIKVGRTFKKLHILQACGYSAEDDTVIGKYVIHYDDKTKAEIEIVYGRDVVDWWAYPDRKGPSRGKVAWEGTNDASKGFDAKIKLYLTTWENPNPRKKVVRIDFLATAPDTGAAPFCVALSAVDK